MLNDIKSRNISKSFNIFNSTMSHFFYYYQLSNSKFNIGTIQNYFPNFRYQSVNFLNFKDQSITFETLETRSTLITNFGGPKMYFIFNYILIIFIQNGEDGWLLQEDIYNFYNCRRGCVSIITTFECISLKNNKKNFSSQFVPIFTSF